jgi:serine/threonine protein kinase
MAASNPAEMLEGTVLDGGWTVEAKVVPSATATGGNFSVGYIVRHETRGQAFLKALDYSRAFRAQDTAMVLQAMTSAYVFERNLLELCGERNLSRVVRALAAGQFDIGNGQPPVNYLIFERADGDVRSHLDAIQEFDAAWVLRVLHNVAVGLSQLHAQGIAHQDVKPSNTLIFDGNLSKIADLGCADQIGELSPRGNLRVAGDPKYAPPELLYSYVSSDWRTRRRGCDLYHLGSMILFLFTGVTTTAALLHYLLVEQYPENWGDPYPDILPHLRNALDEIAEDLRQTLCGRDSDALVSMFRELCDPDPALRGDPKSRKGHHDPYSLQRYIASLDLLARRAEWGWLQGSGRP